MTRNQARIRRLYYLLGRDPLFEEIPKNKEESEELIFKLETEIINRDKAIARNTDI